MQQIQLGGKLWLRFRMGDATHLIRCDSVNGFSDLTEVAELRNTISYQGGKLATTASIDDFIKAMTPPSQIKET